MGILDRALNIGEAKQFKRYEQRVAEINAFEPELELDNDEELRERLDELRARARGGRVARRPAAGVLRDRPRGGQATHGHAPLRRAADRRHGAARRLDRRDAHRRGQDADRDARGRPQHARRQGRARRHRQRLPRAPRRRVDVRRSTTRSASPSACCSRASPTRRRSHAYACDVTYGTNSEFGFDYLRDNMAAQPRGQGPERRPLRRGRPAGHRPQLRDRRRGRQHPDRRGAHAADHQRRARAGGRPLRPVRAARADDGAGQDARGARPAHAQGVRRRLRLRVRREAQDRRGHRGRRRQGRALPRHRPPLPRRERRARQPPDPVRSRPSRSTSATSTTRSSTTR